MATYLLHIRPEEIIRLVRAETDATGGQPEFYESASQDYLIEEDYDRRTYGLFDGNEYDLVTAEAVLNVEPRVEQNYWVLSVVVHNDLGPQLIDDENALLGAELSLDEFESRLAARGAGRVRVRLEAQTPSGKKHFDRWWAELSARHPPKRPVVPQQRVETPSRNPTNKGVRS